MSPRDDRHQAFRDALRERILLIDGAIGTMIQREKLDEAGYRGELLREHGKPIQGLGDVLCLTRPELVSRVHQGYLEVGAEALTTNTFTATSVSLADYGLRHLAYEINRAGASLAREAADRAGREVFVLGSMGPTNRTLSISPDVSDPAYRAIGYDELRTSYVEQAKGLLAGGADLLLVETCFDTLNAKAAIDAAREAIEEAPGQAGLIVSFTAVDMSGRNLTGQTAEAFWISVRHADATAAGINCSLGAAAMRPFLRDLAPDPSPDSSPDSSDDPPDLPRPPPYALAIGEDLKQTTTRRRRLGLVVLATATAGGVFLSLGLFLFLGYLVDPETRRAAAIAQLRQVSHEALGGGAAARGDEIDAAFDTLGDLNRDGRLRLPHIFRTTRTVAGAIRDGEFGEGDVEDLLTVVGSIRGESPPD